MKLLVKFSLVYVAVFGLGLGAAGSLFYRELQRNAREQVLHQAGVIMETALAMRRYTDQRVGPAFKDANQREDALMGSFQDLCARRAALEASHQRKLAAERAAARRAARAGTRAEGLSLTAGAPREDSFPDPFREACARKETPMRVFRPETVPAFSAKQAFTYLGKKYAEYTYKEASLNPTNPRNRAVDWEEDVIEIFRKRPELGAFDGERTTPLGRSLYLARPMRADRSCLECHSTPGAAPPEMVQIYGPANGFGWKENDIIAAQIVSVPVAVAVGMADRVFRRVLTSLVGVASLTLILLNLVLFLTVIRPVSRFAATADEISKGNMDVPELPVRGSDEISILAAAFNRMQRSLAAAMKMLDKQ
jgi:protein-histidine pros-kinase